LAAPVKHLALFPNPVPFFSGPFLETYDFIKKLFTAKCYHIFS